MAPVKDSLPADLQNLSGIGKTILIERRNLVRLDLIHSDDKPNLVGWTLMQQMAQLQRRALMELKGGRP